uniref:Uncharacterized protein n=1 Tax=Romanomermis culicivorax TaxID=13658 RepID=A0A915I565_ROMCU
MVEVESSSTVSFLPEEIVQLGTKYGVAVDESCNDEPSFQRVVVELKKSIRGLIAKEMRLKEGYENLRRATKDRKHSDYLKRDLREISDRIDEMHSDVQTLDIYFTGAVCKYLDTSMIAQICAN